MKIIVKSCTGKELQIEAEPKDTIKNLKYKIEEKEPISPDKQNLKFNGRILEDDEKWLLEYNITEEAIIYLSIDFRHHTRPIFIKQGYHITEIKICFSHNLEYLKELIQNKIGFNSEYQKLYFNGKILDDNEKDISQLGIKDLSIIDLDGGIDNFDYKERFKNELIQLKEMGFKNEENNLQILRVSAGNIRYAIHYYYKYLK